MMMMMTISEFTLHVTILMSTCWNHSL